ncbi:MAG: uroporphyrinogen-III synthase, partial [Acinetobacter junii]
MLFINTRPEDRAHSLNQALIQEGIQVESLPLLELVAEPFTADLMQLYDQLKASQVIVVVSPTAVEIGMLYLKNSGIDLDQLKHIQWIAVGQATAAALKTFGIDSLVPDVESSEGMLQLPILRER